MAPLLLPLARRMLRCSLAFLALIAIPGCKYQYAHLMKPQAENMVGSHAAGAEVFDPLVEEAIAKLLARQTHLPANADPSLGIVPKSVCFVGVENKSAEELGDFKEQLYQQIDAHVGSSDAFEPLSRRMVDAALRETRLRPDSLMVPSNQRLFAEVLEREGSPIEYLLFATLTSG
ncbi:MAG: penicillin-binding protein activator LpoB, partial [Pirellulaceae bacterium]